MASPQEIPHPITKKQMIKETRDLRENPQYGEKPWDRSQRYQNSTNQQQSSGYNTFSSRGFTIFNVSPWINKSPQIITYSGQ